MTLLGATTAALGAIAGSQDGEYGGSENGALALGINGGAVAGALIAPALDWSPKRVRIVMGSSVIGAFVGGMLTGLLARDEGEPSREDGDLVAAMMTVGMWGGFGPRHHDQGSGAGCPVHAASDGFRHGRYVDKHRTWVTFSGQFGSCPEGVSSDPSLARLPCNERHYNQMVPCLLCSSPRSIGVLCTSHGVAIASPGITSEQIFSRVQNGTAAVVDAWGCAHAITDGSRVGRDPRVDVAVLHASVSSEHATMKHTGGKWSIVDNSSRNGTEVEGNRITEQELQSGATLRLGDVKFYFWPEALPRIEPPRGQGRTAPTRRDELVFSAKVVTPRGHQLDLRQRVDGGVLRIGESSIELAAMEFGLLQLLVERRRSVTDAELAYVAWHEIADALSFRSVQADSENVRELVHRVRRKLGNVQADDLIESKRGVGYRLAGEPG